MTKIIKITFLLLLLSSNFIQGTETKTKIKVFNKTENDFFINITDDKQKEIENEISAKTNLILPLDTKTESISISDGSIKKSAYIGNQLGENVYTIDLPIEAFDLNDQSTWRNVYIYGIENITITKSKQEIK